MKSSKDNRLGSAAAARMAAISTERLRYWERVGVVVPTYLRCGTRRFRRYSRLDVKRAVFIKGLVDKDKYSLEGAIRMLERMKGLSEARPNRT